MKWISNLVAAALLSFASLGVQAETVVEYIHTDALGSPVAVTDVNQNVVERSEYEPYGRLLNRPVSDGPGYTGHVADAQTELSYMQQRYYDTSIGIFVSADPMSVNTRNGAGFNRYAYALNNPYGFTDPDGRCEARTGTRICLNIRRFSASDVTIVQSYNTRTQSPVPLGSGSSASADLAPLQKNAAAALNRAGKELQSRGLREHVEIFNKIDVYMSVDTVSEGKAFVSRSPKFDVIINSKPFSRLWDGFKVGAMLHEVHHFTSANTSLYNYQRDNGLPMGPGTPYENDAFGFQRELGFPAAKYFEFDGLEKDN